MRKEFQEFQKIGKLRRVRWSLEWKLRMALGLDFRLVKGKSGYIFLKDRKLRSNYSLYSAILSDDQVIQIAKLVHEVFAFTFKEKRFSNRDIPTVSLNGVSDLSRDFVTTVLNLESSSLHKFLLLVSGNYLLSSGSDKSILSLAESKPESITYPKSFFISNSTAENFLEFYLLPGVTNTSYHPASRMILNSAILRHSVGFIAELLVFLANDSPVTTLETHLKLGAREIEESSDQRSYMDTFRIIETLIAASSEYKDLIYTLTAPELKILAYLMQGDLTKIPVDFLENRVKSMAQLPDDHYLGDWLLSYLSPLEKNDVSADEVEEISNILKRYYHGRGGNPTILYAAIAEVFVQKGYRRTLDVLSVIKETFIYFPRPINFVESTVLLILEALNPENDEMPFSWAAQLSEHSWVMNSEENNEELTLRV